MTIRVFHHRSLEEIFTKNGLNLEALKNDFRQYKSSGVAPKSFRRDAEYSHCNGLPIVRQEKLAHIHLEDPGNPWRHNSPQFNRTSDTHLVYCQGFNGNPPEK